RMANVNPETNSLPELGLFRGYLRLLVRMHLGEEKAGKIEGSDIVQQVMLLAHQNQVQFRGQSRAEMAGWLRQILANQLASAWRAQGRVKRDVERECSLDEELERSASRMEAFLKADVSSPSQGAN